MQLRLRMSRTQTILTGCEIMKLGNYIVIGGLTYLAFYMLIGRKKEEVILEEGGVPIYSDSIEEINRGGGIIEYRSKDGRLSSTNVGFGRYQDGTREMYVGGQMVSSTANPPTTSPTPRVESDLNSYNSINGSGGRSVAF